MKRLDSKKVDEISIAIVFYLGYSFANFFCIPLLQINQFVFYLYMLIAIRIMSPKYLDYFFLQTKLSETHIHWLALNKTRNLKLINASKHSRNSNKKGNGLWKKLGSLCFIYSTIKLCKE